MPWEVEVFQLNIKLSLWEYNRIFAVLNVIMVKAPDFSQDKNENWAVDWQGLLFLRYHFFGSRSFIDPFIEAGFGNAGSVIMNVPEEEQELKLVLYPSLSAGVNIGLF